MTAPLRIEDALKRANVFLKWLPLAIFAGSIGIAYLLYQGFSGDMAVISALVSIVTGIVISMWFWGYQAVRWRLWAYPKVSDPNLLEQKAMNRQLIWPRTHLFTRWELAPRVLKDQLSEMYVELANKSTTMGQIDDRKYPERTVLGYGNTNFIAYLIATVCCLFLMKSNFKVGIGALIFLALTVNEWRKMRGRKKILVIDDHGVEYQETLYAWEQIGNYQIKSLTMQQRLFQLIMDVGIEMELPNSADPDTFETEVIMTQVEVDLDGLTDSPFELEATLDAYKYRHAKKHALK